MLRRRHLPLSPPSNPRQSRPPRSRPALEPNIEATEEPTVEPTPEPTRHPTPKPPNKTSRKPKVPKSGSTVAKIAATPSVAQQLAKLKRQLLAEHIKELAKNPPPEDEDDDDTETAVTAPNGSAGGGPVVSPMHRVKAAAMESGRAPAARAFYRTRNFCCTIRLCRIR